MVNRNKFHFINRPGRSVLLAIALLVSGALGPATLAQSDADATTGAVPDESPIRDALLRAEAAAETIVQIPDQQRTFDNTVRAIDDIVANLELDTNVTQFLAYVSPDEKVRERGQVAEQHYANYLIDLGKREDLYLAVKAFAKTNPKLEGEDKRLLEHMLRDFRRAGMELPVDKRDELKTIEKEITRLAIDFEKNIREDTTKVPLTRDELPGMPDDYLESIEQAGDMYLIGMAYPEFLPVMNLCENETTREKLWIAYKRRGGEKNVRILEQVLKLRADAAKLLGYENEADYVIEVKMAKEPEDVMAFYEKLRPLVRKKAKLDWDEFTQAKRDFAGDANAVLQPWDFSFYEHRLRKDKYAVDMEKVREYFPLDAVKDGLFSITQSLYGISYKNVTSHESSEGDGLWHPDVEKYEVWDDQSGEMLGTFTIDLHPRDNKYTHAAQWGIAQHKVWADGHITKPVAALVCNFTKPTAEKPSLLSHEEVETFFHEFGHCLHTILSEAKHWEFAGTGVERDFVEAPSQMFENWVWDADVLKTFTRHYKTGEPFPDELLEGMLKARYLGSGMAAERQFFYGLFDMKCHTDPVGEVDTTKLAHDLWGERGEGVELYAAVPNTYFHAAFGHLMGYEAGYYGYQWSLVYASDMFQRFKELGMLSQSAGMYYREKILAKGGTQDGMDLVRGYLGREPEMTAYLKHLGLEVEDEAVEPALNKPSSR